ncbi:hypothetical protein EGI22_09045 [Lacihabitans sp. LS3-19]|uniref:PepSY-like domain-containing protein n=1 Tax=Lacihabitans sp. LS3-19 TaxID=2487335 RepID=UPI0020CBC18F|nr:hypothetical protein [Lacihabitans sp. LS3-19]MCP9768058.1 hypothetical protein [Lacihabitans sp. LS3-19]
MKNLKVLVLVLFGAMVGLTSCDMSNISPSTNDESAMVDFLFLATADSSGTGHQHGKKRNLTEIDVNALPANVTSYISTNYVGSTIERAAQDDSSKYAVKIILADSTHRGLLFDASGNFLKEFSGKCHGGSPIEISALPTEITSYITTNYADATIKNARQSPDGKYGVLIINADETVTLLGFDTDGKFLNVLTMDGKGGHRKGGPKKGKGPFGKGK